MRILNFRTQEYVILFSLIVGFLISCQQNQKKIKSTSNVATNGIQISIDTFSNFPPEIDGCACYFSNNKSEFEKGKYIYADNYDSLAFVSINGKMTKFIREKSDTLSGQRSIWLFSNTQYELTIDIKQTGQIDETWQEEGTLKLKAKTGKELIKKIYGECGC